LELLYWKELDVRYSIDVMHVDKNVCESLLRTLLNADGKTRDLGHAQVVLKKMGIRPRLWLNDSVKRTELPTSCITISKHEEFCRAQAFFNLQSFLTVVCLKADEHEF
jgi:hypothetical protein